MAEACVVVVVAGRLALVGSSRSRLTDRKVSRVSGQVATGALGPGVWELHEAACRPHCEEGSGSRLAAEDC